MPSNLKSINLRNETFYINHFFAQKLIEQVKLEIEKDIYGLGFKEIEPFREIDETYLSQIIQALEKEASAIANLTCGLLLQGLIKNTMDEEKDESYKVNNLIIITITQ
jgi:hypothetical protein